MNKFSLSALAAAGLLVGGLTAGSASAADLGGDCCADLEERVAELEATTARKGNRKVSLTISGWVSQQVTWWDDGVESNAYVTDLGGTLSSHFKLSGQANFAPGWSAGYVMHVETRANDALFALDQNTDDATGIALLQSYWFLNSDQLGRVSVGLQSSASDNTAILVDGSGSLIQANWVLFEGDGFFANRNSARVAGGQFGAVRWADISHCYTLSVGIGGGDCNGATTNVVRYDTPTFAGFSMSASWGEDDQWDVAARYAGEMGGFKLAFAAAYTQTTDHTVLVNLGDRGKDIGFFQAGAYAQHVPTGLFVYGAFGQEYVETSGFGAAFDAAVDDGTMWMVKAGLRQRFSPLGHTVLYGFYAQAEDMASPALVNVGSTDVEISRWGAGIVQEIDAAAMSMWLKFEQVDGEINNGARAGDFDELNQVTFGAMISF